MARTPKPALFPRALLEQPNTARRDYFRAYTVAHPTLATVDRLVWNAIHEPAGALLVLLAGPTGVGKTTMLDHLEQRLCEEALPRLEQDPGHLPVMKLFAANPATRQFKWSDFFTRALLAIREPLVDYKVNPQALAERGSPSFTPRNRADAATLQLSWEHAVHYRRPVAVFIDEAQHLGKIGSGSSLLGQLDFLKSLAILTNTVYVLAGTYELLTLDTLPCPTWATEYHRPLSALSGNKQGRCAGVQNGLAGISATSPVRRDARSGIAMARLLRLHGGLCRPAQGMVAQSVG